VPPFDKSVGIRVPMIIVSPYAKPGYTDSTDAQFASVLSYVEHNFGVPPLTSEDAKAYDYSNAFDYAQTPILRTGFHPVVTRISRSEQQHLAADPPDPDDPT
jgi:phospholipase C